MGFVKMADVAGETDAATNPTTVWCVVIRFRAAILHGASLDKELTATT